MLTEFQLNVGGYAYTGASNEAAYAHLMDCDLRSFNNNCMWGYYVSVSAEGIRVDERPNYWPVNENKTRVVYREPLLGVGTASRSDIATIIATVHKKCVVEQGFKVVLLVGDFQTFGHMVRWNKMNKTGNSWMCPVPGEWHWWVHSLMAINQEWWDTNFSRLNAQGEFCEKGVEQKWDGVEKFNRYKFFHETYIIAAMQYLTEIVPAFAMKSPSMLVETCKENKGAMQCESYRIYQLVENMLTSC